MTTITRERIELFVKSPLENGLTRGEQMELARIALPALEAEPIGAFHIVDQQVGGTSDYIKGGEWPIDNGVIDVYSAPPVQETGVYKDMLNIIGLLENNEWAEHCTSTVLGSLLESEITRLVGKEQPAPVMPVGLRMALSNAGIAAPESDEMLAATHEKYIQALVTWVKDRKPFQPAPVVPEEITADGIIGMHECGFVEGWNACRAAMLQAGNFREIPNSSTNNCREISETSTNSPVIPDGWISCSEQMPENGQECLVQTSSGWRYVSFYDAHSRLFYDSPKGDIEYILVTHWMPIPETPQQENL